MPQTLLQLLRPMLSTVAEELQLTDVAVVLPEAEVTSPHLLVRTGRLSALGWRAVLEHAEPGLLRVPLARTVPRSKPAWLCLYAPGRRGWSAQANAVAVVLAHAIGAMMDAYGGEVDWQQITASRRILAVNEEELCRLVLDIHDGPVQKLFAALNLLDHAAHAHAPAAPNPTPDALLRAIALLEAALLEIRTFLGAFRPPEFADSCLEEVLEALVIQHEEFTGVVVQLEAAPALPPVSVPVKIALYRIVQEALANAYRHANVHECIVRLWAQRARVYLEIIDHGLGFEPPPLVGPFATEAVQHIGLRGMRDRIHLVNGSFWVHSAPGQGTTVHVEAPADG